jgi:hypothetical protein
MGPEYFYHIHKSPKLDFILNHVLLDLFQYYRPIHTGLPTYSLCLGISH